MARKIVVHNYIVPRRAKAKDADKQTKAEVGYSRGKGDSKCANCVFFAAPNGCKRVEGTIDPNGWCRLFERGDAAPTHEPPKSRIEAYGVKGPKSTPWRKVFASQEEMERWLEKNKGDVQVYGTRAADKAKDERAADAVWKVLVNHTHPGMKPSVNTVIVTAANTEEAGRKAMQQVMGAKGEGKVSLYDVPKKTDDAYKAKDIGSAQLTSIIGGTSAEEAYKILTHLGYRMVTHYKSDGAPFPKYKAYEKEGSYSSEFVELSYANGRVSSVSVQQRRHNDSAMNTGDRARARDGFVMKWREKKGAPVQTKKFRGRVDAVEFWEQKGRSAEAAVLEDGNGQVQYTKGDIKTLDAMPTKETTEYKGYKLVKLDNGWWRVVGQSNQEPTLPELKAYIDKMVAAMSKDGPDLTKIPSYELIDMRAKALAQDPKLADAIKAELDRRRSTTAATFKRPGAKDAGEVRPKLVRMPAKGYPDKWVLYNMYGIALAEADSKEKLQKRLERELEAYSRAMNRQRGVPDSAKDDDNPGVLRGTYSALYTELERLNLKAPGAAKRAEQIKRQMAGINKKLAALKDSAKDTDSKDLARAKAVLTPLGIEITRTEYDEYRVNFKGGKEATAYYTDDIDDAIGTGKAMAAENAKR